MRRSKCLSNGADENIYVDFESHLFKNNCTFLVFEVLTLHHSQRVLSMTHSEVDI